MLKQKLQSQGCDCSSSKTFFVSSFIQSWLMIASLYTSVTYSFSTFSMWHWWKTFFLDILNKHAPITKIKIKGNCLPFVTSEIKSLIRQRDYLRAKANKTGSNILRQAFVQIKNKVNYKLALLRKNIL